MSKQITVKGFIHAHKYDWEEDYSHKFSEWEDMAANGYILICPHELTFTMPDGWSPVPGQIAALEAEKATAQAEFTEKVRKINERISKLQAIEYVPAAEASEIQFAGVDL